MNQKNYIALAFGEPVEVSLKYSTPLMVTSRSNTPLAMFTTSDGRKLYVPPATADQIQKLALQRGDIFRLTKTKATSGSPNYTVERVSPSPAARLIANAGDFEALDGRETPVRGKNHQTVAGNPSTRLEDALKTAVSAAREAEQHAQSIGYQLRFQPSDIRAMAISVLIGMESRRVA